MTDAAGRQAPNAWRVLALLFLANLLNFYDRTISAILNEPIRIEWGLNDFQLGLIAAAFTVVYAVAGLPLGRLADRGSHLRWVDDYFYAMPFAEGTIESHVTIDVQGAYTFSQLGVTVLAGGTNVTDSENLTAYGAAPNGRIVYLGLRYTP